MKKIKTYQGVLDFLYKTIPHAEFMMFPGNAGLDRMRYALSLLDNPQEKINVIHIAGTSGKGSTATILSYLLHKHNLRIGLSVSPFLVDIRERMQINNKLISKGEFVQFFNKTSFVFEETEKKRFGKLTYFEALTAITFYLFWKNKVDYAIMETGMGGWYDATNTVHNKNKICLLTKIGLDHTHILGETLSKIALQKAMIMQKGNKVLSIEQDKSVENVFTKTAKQQGASLEFIRNKKNIQNVHMVPAATQFDFISEDLRLKNLHLSLIGSYQAENAAVALGGFRYITKREKLKISDKQIRNALTSVVFPGRFQVANHKGKQVIIDGAHNPQKMQAFIQSLKVIYPGKKFTFLIAVKKGKDTKTMLKTLLPVADEIYVGSFLLGKQDLMHVSQAKKEMITLIQNEGFSHVYELADNVKERWKLIDESKNDIVITGSLYFIASIQNVLKYL